MNKKSIATAGVIGAVVFSLSGCNIGNKAMQPYKDAGRNGEDNSPALIVLMPDGFSNAATKCIPGTSVRITSAYHGDSSYASVTTVIDPSCGAK